MIALNSECVLVEYPSGELRPCFPEDITPEMLEMEPVDPDYFLGAVEAVFTYVNRENYLGRLRLGELSQLVSSALISQPGKLIRHVDLQELIPAEFQYGELAFFQKLREVLLSLENSQADLIFVKGIRGCTLSCTHRQRWSKRARRFAEKEVMGFVKDERLRKESGFNPERAQKGKREFVEEVEKIVNKGLMQKFGKQWKEHKDEYMDAAV